MNSALTAKDLFLEKYPDATIEVVDTMVNTVLQGLVVREAVRIKSRTGFTSGDFGIEPN